MLVKPLYSSSFFDRMDGESDDAFFRRVTAAASDPETFERMVLNQQQQADDAPSVSNDGSLSAIGTSDTEAVATTPAKKGYVRAEVWDAEEQRRRKSGELTWEERVQFEGQRYGNQVNQNDILRHHLNAFK